MQDFELFSSTKRKIKSKNMYTYIYLWSPRQKEQERKLQTYRHHFFFSFTLIISMDKPAETKPSILFMSFINNIGNSAVIHCVINFQKLYIYNRESWSVLD